MSIWTLDDQSTGNRVFRRPLGDNEYVFYLDSLFAGTADTVQTGYISTAGHLLEAPNVARAWCALKQKYPLLGARFQERDPLPDGRRQVDVVVEEHRLTDIQASEIEYSSMSSAEEVTSFFRQLQNTKRCLTASLPARVFIIHRPDIPGHAHVGFLVAHLITDGAANLAILRTFFNILSQPEQGYTFKLEERIDLASAAEDLVPLRHLSVARRRWRQAIGTTIGSIRMSKLSGGHTIPRTTSSSTPYTPADSQQVRIPFSTEETKIIFQQCRKHGLTFGVILPILGQVAIARILCHQFLQGKISPEEWEFRKREPMYTAGPLNLRPFLDPEWYNNGGADNVCLSIGFFFYSLPFLPLGSSSMLKLGDSLPSFHDLLSLERMVHRAKLVKRQAEEYIRHPLFIEIGSGLLGRRLTTRTKMVNDWIDRKLPTETKSLSHMEQSQAGVIFGHTGSSFGSMDNLIPADYPIGYQGKPSLTLISVSSVLRCRPTELYLGASSSRGNLGMQVYYDGNCFEREIVTRWLAEVKAAVQHYLIFSNSGSRTGNNLQYVVYHVGFPCQFSLAHTPPQMQRFAHNFSHTPHAFEEDSGSACR